MPWRTNHHNLSSNRRIDRMAARLRTRTSPPPRRFGTCRGLLAPVFLASAVATSIVNMHRNSPGLAGLMFAFLALGFLFARDTRRLFFEPPGKDHRADPKSQRRPG